MKVSEQWLREWVNPDIDANELGQRLTLAGLELDGTEAAAADFSGVVVGKIVSFEKHPNADKLNVCQVDIGNKDDSLLQIVCGAKNVSTGMKAPLAMIGAKLSSDGGKVFKIKKSKLRGVLSQGMLCAGEELGIEDNSEGLLVLSEEAPLGTELREYLRLDDTIFDIDLTPNRADCFSLAGVAREVGVLTETDVNAPQIDAVAITSTQTFPARIQATEQCPHYVGRVIENINPKATTPLWMQERLRRSGIRSLSSLVDVTNYVLLELGQPMHAFDLDKLEQGLTVRQAEAGEKLTLLEGQDITLQAGTLVIADDKAAVALAGIMGGKRTAVGDNTQTIFLESACFLPESMAGQARRYGLHTESSLRFERGVSVDLQVKAIERASQLIVEICGGAVGEIIACRSETHMPKAQSLSLRRQRITQVLGIVVDDNRISGILRRLGCDIENTTDGWQVSTPVFRYDLKREIDLIEEVARIYGYDHIPAHLSKVQPRVTLNKEDCLPQDYLQQILVANDYQESVTFSFVEPEIERLLAPKTTAITLANPISSELSVMRSTLWSGLIQAIQHNLNRQQQRIRLFETGLSFLKAGSNNEIQQHKKLAGAITGTVSTEHWNRKTRPVDFFDVKGDVEALLASIPGLRYSFYKTQHPALHPGQAAEIRIHVPTQADNFTQDKGLIVGFVGVLHPRIEKTLGIGQSVFLFELDLELLKNRNIPIYQKISKFPAIRRDLALLVDKEIPAEKIYFYVKKAATQQLIDYYLFDVYTGEGVANTKKSIALALIFQDISRTLEDAEITELVNKIVKQLEIEPGITLRS